MNRRFAVVGIGALVGASAFGQVPDLVTALDAGGRAMGMGGATYATGGDTLSNYHNPAGLGLISRATIGGTFRNFPQSKTTVTGDIGPTGTQRLSSTEEKGPTGLGHLGIALPLKNKSGGNNGVIGLSITAAGQLRDSRVSGTGLTEGGLNATGYNELIKSDTHMVNLSYGASTQDGTFAWGVGAIYAINKQLDFRNAPSGITRFDSQATGWGAQAGILLTPKGGNDTTFGLSVRTPISLKTGGASPLIYGTIPGRIEGGIAVRKDGFRSGSRDFLVLGADVQHFFGGKNSLVVDRSSQTVLGAGLEYNYAFGNFRVPLRFGYQFVPAGGTFYGARNALTYGLGIRPANGDWTVDLNFGSPTNGGKDTALAVSYRFGK